MKHILLCLALVAGSVRAEFIDGNKLLSDMKGAHGFQMSALGYVMGVADAIQGAVACVPQSVTSGQLRDMVFNYLEATPAVRHFPGDALVTHVIKQAWPCAAKQGRQL
jgi:hypothetical protein